MRIHLNCSTCVCTFDSPKSTFSVHVQIIVCTLRSTYVHTEYMYIVALSEMNTGVEAGATASQQCQPHTEEFKSDVIAIPVMHTT